MYAEVENFLLGRRRQTVPHLTGGAGDAAVWRVLSWPLSAGRAFATAYGEIRRREKVT